MKKPLTKPTQFIAVLTAAFLITSGGYILRSSQKQPLSSFSVESKGAKSGNYLEGEIQNNRKIGQSYQSTLDLQNIGSFRFGSGNEKGKALIDQKVHASFKGKLEEVVLADDGVMTRSYLLISDAEISLTLNDQAANALADQVKAELSKGIVLLRDRSGLVTDIITTEGVADVTADFAYTIAKSIQYQMPVGPLKSEWLSLENDTNGQFQGRYTVLNHDNNLLKLRREKILYSKLNTQIEGNMGGNSLDSETSGEIQLEYDLKSQVLKTAHGSEKLITYDENRQPIGNNEQTISWSLTEVGQVEADHLAELAKVIGERFAEKRSYEAERELAAERHLRLVYEQRLGKDGLQEISKALQDVDSITDQEASERAQTELFLKARALVYLHPEELPRIRDMLSAAGVDSAWFQTMTSALLNISSPEAQKVLVDLALERRDEPKAMQSLIPDLGFIQNPEPFVEDALRTLQKDEANGPMADLAFASMGSQLSKAEGAEERLKIVVEEVHAGIESADMDTLKHKLDMIGNLSSTESMPVIHDALKNSDPEVRSVAAFAMRDVKSQDAEETLKSILTNEADQNVRLNAAVALQNFKVTPALLKFQADLIEKEAFERVRIQLLINIAKAKYMDRETVRQILVARSQSDANEQVRNYADLLLTEFTS